MPGLDDLVALLREYRDSDGLLSRASVVARGVQAMAGLSPDERRGLAVEVARRAAPDLVPRIEQERGKDLSAAQVRAVLDMVGRLDRSQLDDLLAGLTDPAGRAVLGEQLLDRLDDETPAERAASPPVRPEPEPSAPPDPGGPEKRDATARADDVVEQARREAEQRHDQIRTEIAELEERLAAEREAVTAAGRDARADEGDAATDRPPPGDQDPDDEPDAAATMAVTDAPLTPGGVTDTAAVPPPGPHLPPGAAEEETAPAAGPDAAGGVLRRVQEASSSRAVLGVVAAAGEDLWELGPDGRRRLLEAIPDGWVRRRAVERMLEADVVSYDEIGTLLGLLGREGDRRWVAGTMVATGLAGPEDLAGRIDDRTLERLRGRVART